MDSPVELVRFATSVLAPPRCAICGSACETGAHVCGACRRALAGAEQGSYAGPSGRVVWAAPYEGTARELVVALKFAGRVALARVAAGRIAARLGAERMPLDRGLEVVPVPAASLRLRRRGFDPAELIAHELAAALGLPFRPCLRRHGARRQVGRDRARRLADPPRISVRGAVPPAALLVDDVVTTGATLAACSGALRAAGCAEVHPAAFARTAPRGRSAHRGQ